MWEGSDDNSSDDGEAALGRGSPTGSATYMGGASSLDEIDAHHVCASNQMCISNGWDEMTSAPYQKDSSLGVDTLGEDGEEGNSHDGHSETGRRYAQYENASSPRRPRVSDQVGSAATHVAHVDVGSSVQVPHEDVDTLGAVHVDVVVELDASTNNDSSAHTKWGIPSASS